ncbi:hypothetical protein niasHS_018006 [Heterodera schachtii]|uniref:Uncharacterized protein n=1 Tax=Heterodera schachtii TaxID=97005 RepID=A0ABD2HW89_HETSC
MAKFWGTNGCCWLSIVLCLALLQFFDNVTTDRSADQQKQNQQHFALITSKFFDFVYDREADNLRSLLNVLDGEQLSSLLYMQYAPNGTEKRLTPLMIAVVMNGVDIGTVLLEKGADPHQMCLRKINDIYKFYATPLWVAASYGHLEFCRLLLAHGADVDLGLEEGGTPLMAACDAGHIDIVTLLVKHGANIETADKFGNTPLTIALATGRSAIARFLVENGARIVPQQQNGYGNDDVINIALVKKEL